MNKKIRVKCPVCFNYTLYTEKVNFPIFDICPVCFWQYDLIAILKPNIISGANNLTIQEARINYKNYQVVDIKFKNKVRNPIKSELPDNNINNLYDLYLKQKYNI